MRFKKILVIVNPVSGRKKPILQPLHEILTKRKVQWDLVLSQNEGDVSKFIKERIDQGYDAIAVYGGDGTVKEASNVLAGKDIPLCILPGGSGNVLSKTLYIPQNIQKACELMFTKNRVMDVDIAQEGKENFMIRISFGFEARMVEKADRGLKAKIGMFAYAIASFYALAHTRVSTYHITLDGKEMDVEGLSCAVINSDNLGLPGLSLSPSIRVNDGLLDVIVIPRISFSALTSKVFWARMRHKRFKPFEHWTAKEVKIKANPSQEIHYDGEVKKKKEIHAKMMSDRVKILVPSDYERRASRREE